MFNITKMKKLDKLLSMVFKNKYIKYTFILMLVILTVNIKTISTNNLSIVNNKSVLIILSLLVVYFVYVDIVLALTLTLFLIVCIQEYSNRLVVMHLNTNVTSNTIDIPVLDNEINNNSVNNNSITNNNNNTTNLEKRINSMSYSEPTFTDEFKKHMRSIAPSSYGEIVKSQLTSLTNHKYENQIGGLGVHDSVNVHSDADEKYQSMSGLYAKVNMGQSISEKENFKNNNNNENSLKNEQYNHPSSKTITELLRVKDVGYINEKNLEMVQTNNAGLNLGSIPCAVESICASMNAQSF